LAINDGRKEQQVVSADINGAPSVGVDDPSGGGGEVGQLAGETLNREAVVAQSFDYLAEAIPVGMTNDSSESGRFRFLCWRMVSCSAV